jgi:TonB family protein
MKRDLRTTILAIFTAMFFLTVMLPAALAAEPGREAAPSSRRGEGAVAPAQSADAAANPAAEQQQSTNAAANPPAGPEQSTDAAADDATAEPVIVPPVLAGFVEAKLPPDLSLAPGVYAVSLLLTIDEAGAVTDATVAASDAPALDEPALAAARAFAFTPATVDGTPVAVQIAYRYAFDIRPKERVVVHRFQVLLRGSRDPIDGVSGLLEENGRAVTAFNGVMEVSDVPPGTYTLYIPEGEYREVRREFTVAPDRVREGTLYLERQFSSTNQTIIRAPREARFVARQTLEAGELRRLPGSGGDVLKMVENLPGIARSAFGSGQLVVFGSPPFDTQVLLNQQPFVMLYHFGGLYSVINPEFIQKIDFVPAGFDASYGRATAGIVNVTLKEEPLTGLHGAVDINLLHAGIVMGGPYSKDGDIQAAFRRSYIDGILKLVPFGGDQELSTAPRYYDYQLKWQHRLGDRDRFMIFVNGTDDALVVVNKRANTQEPKFVGNVGLSMFGHNLMFSWKRRHSATLSNALSVQAGYTGFDFDLFGAIKYRLRSFPVSIREELDWQAHPRVKVTAGADVRFEPSEFDIESPAPNRPGSVGTPLAARETIKTKGDFFLAQVGPFVSVTWQPTPWWTMVPSLRADVYRGTWDGWSIDPRLSNRFDVVKDKVALRLAGGLYRQPPPSFTFLPAFGNPDLGPEAAAHLLAGAEYTPVDGLTLAANGFYKWLFDRAEASEDRTQRYTNRGYGRAFGADFLLRLVPGSRIAGGRLFGWIAYTYTVSQIWDFNAKAYRSSDYEQTHLLNILGSYELPRHWTLGMRFRLSTGYPYTPIKGSVYDADLDRYVAVPGDRINAKRLPLFHQLDLRVDKEWIFDRWKFGLYLEIQNVYYQKNAEALLYNYDFSKVGYVGASTILPVLGLKGEF